VRVWDGIPLEHIRKEYLPSVTRPLVREELGVDEIDTEDVGDEDDHWDISCRPSKSV
jgi:hypothetical protein